MTPIEKLTLSFRCTQDIEKMTPTTGGRFCSHCHKTVIDFRDKNLSQLSSVLEKEGVVCGIFTKEQTAKNGNPIVVFFRRLAASFLFGIGLGFYHNQLMAQNNHTDSLVNKQEGENLFPFMVGEVGELYPTYKHGGEKGLFEFLKNNINYPSDSVQGKVLVAFTVDTTGKVVDAKILKGLSEPANKEVLRVVNLLEFVPGTRNGKKVPIQYALPILFDKNKEDKNK